jgi:hypothetical protein
LLASAPASVLIPAGSASASFAITTAATTVSTAVTFTATYSGVSKTASLNVTTGPTFLLAGNSSELPALINGTAVTPTIAPAGLTGHLVVRGTGAAAFASANATDGLVFSQPGQQAANTAFLSFAGAPIGAMFNMNEGDLTFYLKSSYSLAERLTGGGAYRFAFQVDDGTQRLFFFAVSAANSRLVFSYATGSASSISYAVPVGQEDVVFGKNFAAKFRLAWDGVRTTLYINDTNVNSVPYTPAIPNWTSSASFTIGATSLYPYGGGYFGNDDAIADFQLK